MLTLALALSPVLLAPEVLVVDANDPGGAYTRLQDALAAAAPGDTVLVHAGDYAVFESFSLNEFVVTRGIDIVAAPGAAVRLSSPVTVVNLPVDETVRLRGIEIDCGTDSDSEHVTVLSSVASLRAAGTVWLEDCTLTAPKGFVSLTNPPASPHAIRAAHSRLVLVRTSVKAPESIPIAGAALFAEDCDVLAYDSTFDARLTTGLVSTSPAAILRGSTLFASGSLFAGADGSGPVFPPFITCGGNGAPAIQLAAGAGDSAIELLDCELIGGAAGQPQTGCTGPTPVDGPDVLDEAGTVAMHIGAARSLAFDGPVVEGTGSALAYAGQAGDPVVLGLAADAGTPFELFDVPVSLPVTALVLVAGVADGAGALTLPFVAPALAAGVDASRLHAQALAFDGGGWSVSSPTFTVFLDDAL